MASRRTTAEYLPPADFDLALFAERLAAPLHLAPETEDDGERVFYDTFDRRLRGKDLRLAREQDKLRLWNDGARELGAVTWTADAESIEPQDLPAGTLREAIAPVCDPRVLLRIAHLRSERRVTAVLDDEGKTVARIVCENASVAGGAPLRPRLHLIGVRGYDKELARVRTVLEDDFGLQEATERLEDEAVLRAGGAARGLPPGAELALTADLPADRAAVGLSLRLLHSIEANMPGTLADLDTEFLHDLRVAVRRTRALQRELKKVFPPNDVAHFRREFKWLQQVTGTSRDLDVYLLEFDDFTTAVPPHQRDALGLLRSLLEEHRARERVVMDTALRSDRTNDLLSGWADFLERLPTSPVDDRPQAVTPIGEVAAQRIDKVYRRMVKMGAAISVDSSHEALHDLRKKGKELRYLLEFFAPLFPGKVTKPMVKTLKALQDTLGRFQDREVQAEMVRNLGPELASRPGGAGALMAMGVLVERLGEQQGAARSEFAERFAAFSSAEQQALVKATFR
jgi:CHAD domain-containing protein